MTQSASSGPRLHGDACVNAPVHCFTTQCDDGMAQNLVYPFCVISVAAEVLVCHCPLRVWPSTIRSARRTGSAAPHSSWSPTVNTVRYSSPIAIRRTRPTATVSLPATAHGVRRCSVSSFVFGTKSTHSLWLRISRSTSSRDSGDLSFRVIDCRHVARHQRKCKHNQHSMGLQSF